MLRLCASCALVLALSVGALFGLNLIGGALAPWLGLARGGTVRLAWDLAWLLLSCGFALWLVARWAPAARRTLAWGLWALISAAAIWAVLELGGDFPAWFRAAVLLLVPVLFGWVRWLRRADRMRRSGSRGIHSRDS